MKKKKKKKKKKQKKQRLHKSEPAFDFVGFCFLLLMFFLTIF